MGAEGARPDEVDELLALARRRALDWLHGLPERPIPPRVGVEEVVAALGPELPAAGEDPLAVVERLAAAVEPGLIAMPSPRFFGWVIGGTQPVALAADWLVSAWDQNSAMRDVTPGVLAAEAIAGRWILELLGLPPAASVGFTTGATMAGFVGLAAARARVLERFGHDVERDGLAGAPRIRMLTGAEGHDTIDKASRMLGLGRPETVAADAQGRIDPVALAAALDVDDPGPTILVLQAGNIHSGAFDPFGPAIDLAHRAGAWVHVDGAFGLWAAASPRRRALTEGVAAADSWSTDAHKTLNVPYDCGIAIVADPSAATQAFGMRASYLAAFASDADPHDRLPELSRRARGVPSWAVLRALGRDGVAALVDRLADAAAALAEGLARIDGLEVRNEVVFTQVSAGFADDARTLALQAALAEDGEAFASRSQWRGREVVRFSVSNAGTDADQVARTLAAVERAAARVR